MSEKLSDTANAFSTTLTAEAQPMTDKINELLGAATLEFVAVLNEARTDEARVGGLHNTITLLSQAVTLLERVLDDRDAQASTETA